MKPSLARDFAGIAVVVFGLGCGGPPAPPPATAPLPLGREAVAPVPSSPKGEAGPRAPEDVALILRVSDPEQLANEIAPFLPQAVASTVADYRQILQLMLGKRLADVVDLAQPIDVASIGHEPSFVISFAVKSEAEARLDDGLSLREDGGLLHVENDEGHSQSSALNACAFTAASGRASMRLVCATDQATLEKTAKYLTRTLASEPLDADIRLMLPGGVLRAKRDTTTKAIADAASARLGTALVDRFVEEIDRLDLDLRWMGGGISFGVDLRLNSRESMLARVLVPKSKPALPPPSFYRLPADSLVALHTTGAQPEDIGPLRTTLGESVVSTLVRDGYRPSPAHAVRERLFGLLLTGGPLVLAAGVAGGREGAEKALTAFENARAKSPEEAKAEVQLRAALVPWMMAEVDEPPERWTQGLRDLLRRIEEAERTRTPGSKASTARDPDGNHVDVRAGTLDPAWRLPKDALHLEVLLAARTKGQRPTRIGHLFAVPKERVTWLGYSEDIPAITSRLRTAIDDTTEVGTLSKSSAAAALRTRPAVAAGLASLAGLELLGAQTTTYEDLRGMVRKSARASSVGSSSEMMTWTVSADPSPGAVRVALQVQVSRQIALDLASLLGR